MFMVVDPTFHAPIATDLIDGMVGRYRQELERMHQLAEILNGELNGVVAYFIRGNAGDEQLHRSLYVSRLFELPAAIGELNAKYWSEALSLTDVLDCPMLGAKNGTSRFAILWA